MQEGAPGIPTFCKLWLITYLGQKDPISTSTQLPPNRKIPKKRPRTRPFRLDRGLPRSRSRPTNAERRTDYIPLRREAEKRKAELTS
jgi:hypothetical protein